MTQTQPDLLVCDICGSREFLRIFGVQILNGSEVEHAIVQCATCSRRYRVTTDRNLFRLERVPADHV